MRQGTAYTAAFGGGTENGVLVLNGATLPFVVILRETKAG